MIFAENAPIYWEAGLPVIPLRGKAPEIKGWNTLHDKMPSEGDRKFWLNRYKNHNVGLPLGAQSRCVAIDIDTLQDNELKFIDSILPTSPWTRIGAKGKVVMYRFNGEKNFKVSDVTGRMICECLSSRNQVVLPPSIHPTTNSPYIENVPLISVLDKLPTLPAEFERILREGLMDNCGTKLSHSGWTRTTDTVSAGSRDVKMASVAGIYAYGVLRGEFPLRDGIDMMRAWVHNQVEQVAGDNVDPEKGVRNLIKFLMMNVTSGRRKPLPSGWDVGLSEEDKKDLGLEVNAETDVSWTFDRLRNYVKDEVEKTGREDDNIDRIVDYALDKMARSQSMTSLDLDRGVKFISNLSHDITPSALRKRLTEIKQDGVMGVNHTEIARAVLTEINAVIPDSERNNSMREFNSIRFDKSRFWTWGGSNWEEKPNTDILKHIACEYGNLPAASKSNDHLGIVKVMATQIDNRLADVDYRGVNFANGFVDAHGILQPHHKKFGCTYTLPYSYLKDKNRLEDAPKFHQFLKSVWGHEEDYVERVACLRQVIASTMFGYGPSFARAILLYGVGKSGKSQLLRIIENLLPRDVVSAITPYDFSHPFKPVGLATSVLNICGELDEKHEIPSAIFKQVIDGSVMQGQFKRQPMFDFKPKATHWFASNHLPMSRDTTEGFNRRWCIFTFNRMIPENEKVRDIGDIIVAEEREAITSWAVSCIEELNKSSDYALPPSHFKMVNEMRCVNDSLFFFLCDETAPRRKDDCKIEIERLYEMYRAFCYNIASTRPIGLRKFFTRLKELGIMMGFKVDTMYAIGLTLDSNGEKLI